MDLGLFVAQQPGSSLLQTLMLVLPVLLYLVGRGCSGSTGCHWDGCGHPYELYVASRRLVGKQTCRSVHTSKKFQKTEKTMMKPGQSEQRVVC